VSFAEHLGAERLLAERFWPVEPRQAVDDERLAKPLQEGFCDVVLVRCRFAVTVRQLGRVASLGNQARAVRWWRCVHQRTLPPRSDAGGVGYLTVSRCTKLVQMCQEATFCLTSSTQMCTDSVLKRRDLESKLADLGWSFLRHGGKHDVWSRGTEEIAVPRHNEVNELLARALIKRASKKRAP
jgi:mRNA interferase HicA